jgi:hypothetical protein
LPVKQKTSQSRKRFLDEQHLIVAGPTHVYATVIVMDDFNEVEFTTQKFVLFSQMFFSVLQICSRSKLDFADFLLYKNPKLCVGGTQLDSTKLFAHHLAIHLLYLKFSVRSLHKYHRWHIPPPYWFYIASRFFKAVF